MRRPVSRCLAAFAFALALSLTANGTSVEAAPSRVVSLNLCTDELLLLLASPEQIDSVTHLSQNGEEFPWWRQARGYAANDGSVLSVAGRAPDLILTMGGLARDRERIARRLGARLLVLRYPENLDDIEAAIKDVAEALGRERRGRQLVGYLRQLRGTVPRQRTGIFLSSGGQSLATDSLGAQWLALAGVDVPEDVGATVSAERLLIAPPSLVVRSDYRADQSSRGNFWPGFRFLRNQAIHTVPTDGRRWTCAGPSLIPEIRRLRQRIAR